MKADFSVDFAGLKLKNPIIVGPAEISWSASLVKKAADAGAGAVTFKTQHLTIPLDNRPFKQRLRRLFLLENIGKRYDPKLTEEGGYFSLIMDGPGGLFKSEEIVPQIEKAKKLVDIPIIASIVGLSLDEYEKMARLNAEAGADAIEVLEPQHYAVAGVPLKGGSELFRPEFTLADAVKVTKKTTNLPVSAKAAFAWDEPSSVVRNLEKAGADMIVAVGEPCLPGLEIDVETGKALFDALSLGYYGSWFKPASLSWVARAAKTAKIPIIGVSGITRWDHVVEYIMAGATAVEVCSILFARGFKVIGEITSGLRKYMERKKYARLEDFRGITHSKIPTKSEYQKTFAPRAAYVTKSKCTACEICTETCVYDALSMDKKIACVDLEKCAGCELCMYVCPTNAISLKKRSV